MTQPLPPIERSTSVPWTQDAAFQRFTADFATWWPVATHSIGGNLVKRVVFECRVGGRIYEEFHDGRRFQWGKVTTWDPPRRVGFTWHASKDERTAQDVEVRFEPHGAGTRVTLTSSGWEKLGREAGRARKGYQVGWGSVLEVFAGRRNTAFYIWAALSHTITLFLKVTGRREGQIARAGGRMA